MDTMAIACAISVFHKKITPRLLFRVMHHFSLFQAGLLFLGWELGNLIEEYFGSYDHWVALALLWFIGGKMIWEFFYPDREEAKADPSRGLSLIFLSLATSLDALAVGGSLAILNANIFHSIFWAWFLTAAIAGLGLSIGKKVGKMFGKYAELSGGIMLCIIGIKVLISNLL